jgi:hypothetical protein
MANVKKNSLSVLHTPAGYAVLAVAALGLCYGNALLAINSGSLWEYALAIILFVLLVKYLVKSVEALRRKRS